MTFISLAGNMSHPHAQNALTNSVIPLCSAELGKVFVAGSTGELGRRVLMPSAIVFLS